MKRLQSTEYKKVFSGALDKLVSGFVLLMLIAIWQFVVDFGIVKRFILPSPKDVFIAFFNILPSIKGHIITTLQEALFGFFIAIVFALVLAILMDSVKLLGRALYPLLLVSQTVPIIALAPLFVIWFGFGQTPKIIVVVLVCFFPIVINLLDGLNAVDQDMIHLMKSMNASKWQTFKLLKFPATMAYFFSGLRIAATYSIMGAVIGEWLGGEGGLGVYMLRVKHSYALDKMFAVIVLIVILSMTLFKVIDIIQAIVMPWYTLSNKKMRGNNNV